MTPAAIVVFFGSLIGILSLLVLKRAELARGARIGEPIRARADAGALRIKAVLSAGESYLEELPFFVGALVRFLVHVSALSFARFARASARRAHQLADLVSHKHRFERRESRSRFLKEVSEVKNGTQEDSVASR